MLLLAMVAATVTLSISTTAVFVKHTEAAAAEAARLSTLSALLAPPPMPEAHPATLLAALVGQLDPPTLPPWGPQPGPRPPPIFTLPHHGHAPAPEAPAGAPRTPGHGSAGHRPADGPPPPPPPDSAAAPQNDAAAANLQDLVGGAGETPPQPPPPTPPPAPGGFQIMGQAARDMSVAIGVWREKRSWLYQMGGEPARRRRLHGSQPCSRRRLRGALEGEANG